MVLASKYHCLNLRNAVMQFLMPVASHDANTSAIVAHLILIILAKQMQWCHWCCHWYHTTKVSCFISFWSSWPHRWNGAIDDTVGIIWHWHKHHGITWPKNVLHSFNHFDLMNTVVLMTMPQVSDDANVSPRSVKCLKKSLPCYFDHFEQMQWSSLWCHQCHVMPTLFWLSSPIE